MKYPLYLMSVKIELHRRIRRSVVLVRASLMYGTNYKHFNSKERIPIVPLSLHWTFSNSLFILCIIFCLKSATICNSYILV